MNPLAHPRFTEYLHALTHPMIEVIRKLLGIEFQTREVTWSPANLPARPPVVLFRVTGNPSGILAYWFDPPLLREALVRLLGSAAGPSLDESGLDVLGEIGNIMLGNATAQLEALGLRIELSPPTVYADRIPALFGPQESVVRAVLHGPSGDIEMYTNIVPG